MASRMVQCVLSLATAGNLVGVAGVQLCREEQRAADGKNDSLECEEWH